MKKNLPILTGLRFFAAFYVFIFHIDLLQHLDFLNEPLLSIVAQGAIGVNIFFILSGFILFYNYNSKEINFLEFILKRIAKIYPVYIAGFILCLLVIKVIHVKIENYFEVKMMNLLMVQSYLPKFSMEWYGGGSWSLSTEFFFYLCFPILLYIISKLTKKQVVFLGVICFFCSIIPGILFNYKIINFPLSYTFPPSRIWEFIIGMLTACLVGKFKIKINNLIIYLVIGFSILFFFFIGQNLVGYVIQNIIVIPIMVIILISTTTMKKTLLQFLGNIFFEYLGKISYSFYIVQIPLLKYIQSLKNLNIYSSLSILIFIFLINLAGAILMYHLIELPSHQFLNKKIKKIFKKDKPILI